jgi:hypothetical protein
MGLIILYLSGTMNVLGENVCVGVVCDLACDMMVREKNLTENSRGATELGNFGSDKTEHKTKKTSIARRQPLRDSYLQVLAIQ